MRTRAAWPPSPSSSERAARLPALEVVHTNTTHRFLTVAPSGTAYALGWMTPRAAST